MHKAGFTFITLALAATVLPALAAEPVPTVRQVMLGLTVPASDALFNVAEPEYDADLYWETLEAAAVMLAESGHMLQDKARAVDNGEWMAHARDLVEVSLKAAEAAKSRNVDAVFDAGSAVYDVCDACHQTYLPGSE